MWFCFVPSKSRILEKRFSFVYSVARGECGEKEILSCHINLKVCLHLSRNIYKKGELFIIESSLTSQSAVFKCSFNYFQLWIIEPISYRFQFIFTNSFPTSHHSVLKRRILLRLHYVVSLNYSIEKERTPQDFFRLKLKTFSFFFFRLNLSSYSW